MKIKFGVIGANPQLRASFIYLNFPGEKAELAAVCDHDPEMVEVFRKTYPDFAKVKVYSDYRGLVEDSDVQAVFIAVRDQYHEEMAVAALEAGKAVYLEKPMAITIEGCDRILETAYRTGSRLMVGHNMRYTDFVLKMKEIIDSGVIGEIQAAWCRHFINYGSCYFRHWCSEQKNCTGLLLQKGAHDIDIIHWLCGGYTERVSAMGRLSVYNRTTGRRKADEKPDRRVSFTAACWPPLELKGLSPVMNVEDHSMLLMQLSNGVQASYEQCMYAPDTERNYTFIGTRGRVENIGDYHGKREIHVWTRRGLRNEPDIVYHLKDVSGTTHGGSDEIILEAFFDFLLKDQAPSVSPVAARNAVAAGVLGHYSMRNGSVPRDIPPLRPELVDYFENGQHKNGK